ncbi:MAG TPA: hypothetical protein VFG31_03540 [Conexibacter sp.]|nr:hypothetical protein [Conexibacter sp.]
MSLSSARTGEYEQAALRAPAIVPSPRELAWIASLPIALLTFLAVVALGPPLGHALLAPGGERIWPREAPWLWGSPEPVKHARIALAMVGAVALPAAVLLGAHRRAPRLSRRTIAALVVGGQLLACAALVVVLVAQPQASYVDAPAHWRIFSVPTLVVGALIAAALAAVPHRHRLLARATRLAAERRVERVCLLVAVLLTAVWLLPDVATEHTAAKGSFPDLPPWAMGDAYAVLDGRTPLVDFHAVYSQLWPYVAAAPMALFGDTIGVFTIAMVTISGAALLALYGVLRRVVRSAPLALALYLPLLATSLYEVSTKEVAWRVSNGVIYSVWPMRYAGPLLLAWLTARQLDGARPRAAWALGLAGGLVVVNNLELGLGALAGTFLALACVPRRWSRRALARLAAELAAGVVGAVVLVSLLTLVRAGSLPHFDIMLEFPHIFGSLGLVAAPMPTIAFHLVLYLTLVAALAAAAVRVARRADDVLLTGMLAWSGAFGLMAGSYYAGRSDAIKLAALLPAWSLALSLLTVTVLRGLVVRRPRLPAPAELAVLFGWGLTACSLAQLHAPWSEIARLERGGAPAKYAARAVRRFVDAHTRPGERVAIVVPMAHRVAYELRLANVSPYGTMEEMATRAQFHTLLKAMRTAHAHKLFLPNDLLEQAHALVLQDAGFTLAAAGGDTSYWSDAPGG